MKPNTVGRAKGIYPFVHPNAPIQHDTGFLPGTPLLTQDGEMPVDFLSPGDGIITRNAGLVRLDGIECVSRTLTAILIAAGSLGDTRPDQDLILPGAQPVLVRDWRAVALFGRKQAVVRADALVDGEFIRDLGKVEMRLVQLRFKQPHILYVGGLEVGTNQMPTCAARSAA